MTNSSERLAEPVGRKAVIRRPRGTLNQSPLVVLSASDARVTVSDEGF